MSETFVCDICGEEQPLSQRTEIDDQELCESCFQQETLRCSECGEQIWQEDHVGDEDTPLCQSCFDRHYTTCAQCSRTIHSGSTYYVDEDEEDPLCYDCFIQADSTGVICDYSYKPESIFYGEGPLYLGVELELDEGGCSSANAKEILNLANREDERVYCKHDGSLTDGFEIVTHPLTLRYHQTQMPWESILKKAATLGYLSHQANTCGLHVHVSRSALGATEEERDATISRILYFFEKHWEELLKFSRRSQRQLERWAARYGYKDQPMEILEHAKEGCRSSRYTSVNLQNHSTIEFRIFRGTLKYNTLIATLQLVDRVCDVALFMSDSELKDMSWTTFVSGCQAPELVQYLKERRLYINEPVEGEVEL